MSEYQSFDPTLYLEHYGVKGMKWGIRRSPEELGRRREYKADKKEYKKLKRQTAASIRNLKQRGKMLDDSMRNVREAELEYNKALSMTTLPWNRQKKYDAMNAASAALEKAHKDAERPQANLERAKKIHDDIEKAYREKATQMISKYGSNSVKSLKSKTINLGENYTKEVERTGITVANLPFIGNWYTGNVISNKEYYIRENLRTKKANDWDKDHY